MDVLTISLWILSIIITHLLLRRVVEIDTINRQLMKGQSESPIQLSVPVEEELTEEELQRELMEYVSTQDYDFPKSDNQELKLPLPIMTNQLNNNMAPMESTNIIQTFETERDINSGVFGSLRAYEDNGYATL